MKLLLENWREHLSEISLGTDIATGIRYTALILNDMGHRSLLLYVPEGWTPIAHHMTILRPREGGSLPSRWLGAGLCVSVVGIALNDRVASALVALEGIPLPTKGIDHPHITIAVNPLVGAKPAESNKLQMSDYERIEPINVCGTIREIEK